ncbi:SGNH/GDSL hydrolase family protein [Balneola vulgaris]|uniref:SGNH/GDSL hydrolase family protein n=1 Tax=Balneola vulgaris TaxID=287535 RepID=UPI000363433B|nr:SGNH/GDSL hydrolase family protein [Balneola vulgaris]
MNKLNKSILVLLTAGFFAMSCEGIEDSLVDDRLEENPQPTPEEYTSGDADFSTYVAIGNSLAAGYMDAALYNNGQNNSIPNLIAAELSAAVDGGLTFNQPSINSVNGFNTAVSPNPDGNTIFGRFKLDTSIPGPSPTINGEVPTAYTGPAVHNFGVPGVTVGDLLVASSPNPALSTFYYRFASDPGTSTIIGDAAAAQPTFFTLWIGNNDVLGYAAGGASNSSLLTSTTDFETRFNAVINTMMANTTADGVVTNIPPLLGAAYFRAVPYNAIPLDAQTAAALNAGYEDYNNGLEQARQAGFIDQAEKDRRTITFAAGANAFVMEDETLTDLSALGLPNLRQSESTDLAILSLGAILGVDLGDGAYGLQDAVEDQYVLIVEEQVEIETARQTFNGIIAAAVSANSDRLVLHDTNAATGAFADLFGISDQEVGITIDGVDLTADFAPSGVLSTDGIHPNPRGNGILANEIIATIEAKWGAKLPRVNVLGLPSVTVCGIGDCASEQSQ